MLTRKQLILLMAIGFFLALLLKILQAIGLVGSIDFSYYAILYPFAILWAYTDIILEKFGYHPNIFWPDDVPPLLWVAVFIFLVIAIPLAFYLACRILRAIRSAAHHLAPKGGPL